MSEKLLVTSVEQFDPLYFARHSLENKMFIPYSGGLILTCDELSTQGVGASVYVWSEPDLFGRSGTGVKNDPANQMHKILSLILCPPICRLRVLERGATTSGLHYDERHM